MISATNSGDALAGVCRVTAPPTSEEVDKNLFLDFLTRKVMRGWLEHEPRPATIPWTPLRKPLASCRVALVSSAGVALKTQPPFDQEGERRDPWWGDPSFRLIPRGADARDVRLYHLHVDPSFGEQDLNCVMPLARLADLAVEGVIGEVAPTHYSFMGYLLRPGEFLRASVPAMIEQMKAEGVDLALLVPA